MICQLKHVLLLFVGGIRCEKASAYIRRQVPSVQEVRHLKGGIHKYLDEFGNASDCLWEGKNFVFDGRGAHEAAETNGSRSAIKESTAMSHKIVGTCSYCPTPYDTFDPTCVCTVCREPTLVCPKCKENLEEYHCRNHDHLKLCYFTDLSRFSSSELQEQFSNLQNLVDEIAVGRKFKQKRKTLKKQCDKILQRLAEIGAADIPSIDIENRVSNCRNCGEAGCSGLCWGFHGLKRKIILDERNQQVHNGDSSESTNKSQKDLIGVKKSNNAHLQERKELQRKKLVEELIVLELARPVSSYQKDGIRVPPPCTRVLQTNTKGKWCGRALLPVLQTEFSELTKTDRLSEILERGLLRVNGTRVTSLELAESLRLKNMDVIGRIVHWHEPPVCVPSDKIVVQKVALPVVVQEEHSLVDALIYVCDKPSTVPVHPAGPYLSNSLTVMVEAQEGLAPRSLIPCHRIDRVTSGLTICCTDVKVARLVQARISEGSVKKQYLAKVHGRFPGSLNEVDTACPESTELAQRQWCDESKVIQVEGPIETVDPANGIRRVTAKGKESTSLFQYLSYNSDTDTSIISCCPLTGRSHQLRVHLQWLGFPIVDDIQYGGKRGEGSSLMHGVERVVNSIQDLHGEGNADKAPADLSDDDVRAAKAICPCCRDVSSSFTPSQLLQGGHEICLHAYRYQVPFLSKAKKSAVEPITTLDLQVSLPIWAKDTDCDHMQWLK
jgi:23S rRNA-/tRNA-specific pseudouridylate synthase